MRSNAAVEYLGGTVDRVNLHIAVNSFVTKIEIKDKHARGVYVIRNGRKHFIKTTQEMVISGGAINSPQILMLSGIGPKDHLNDIGIDTVADLPVGQNLQDHQNIFIPSKINSSISITDKLKESMWSKLKFYVFGKGPLTVAGPDGSAFLYVDEANRGKRSVQLQIIFISSYSYNNFYQSPLILTELFQHNLINVSYLACYLYQVMMTLHFLNDE